MLFGCLDDQDRLLVSFFRENLCVKKIGIDRLVLCEESCGYAAEKMRSSTF